MNFFDYGKQLNASSVTGTVTPGTAVAYFRHIVEGNEYGAYTIFAQKDKHGVRLEAVTEDEKARVATSYTVPEVTPLGNALVTLAEKINSKFKI